MHDLDVTVVPCVRCGPVPVLVGDIVVHRDAAATIALWAVPCPGCGELASGGCPTLVADLLGRGATTRQLTCPSATDPTASCPTATDPAAAAPAAADGVHDVEVAALRAWLDTDPCWDDAGTG